MLKSMRKNMKAIMWVLLATFVLWGGSSAMFSRSRSANPREYERNYSAVENQARLMYGEKYTQLKQYLNLEQQAWDRVILLREAKKKRINVSDAEVVEMVCRIPLFQDSSGKFIPDIYMRVVEYFLKAPAREFEDQLKDTIKISKLREKIVSGITIADAEALERYRARNEKVNADYAIADKQKAQELFNTIKQNIGSGWTFRKACDTLNLKVETTGLFTKAGYIPKIGLSEEFADIAFSGKAGQLAAKPATVPQGEAIIFVLEKSGIDEERFKKEKEEFKKIALDEKRSDYFEQYFKTLKQKTNIKTADEPK